MTLSKDELDNLVRLIGLTRDEEINCEHCLLQVAEFAEHALAGKTLSAGLEAVQRHLELCGECREEYEALQRALGSLRDESS